MSDHHRVPVTFRAQPPKPLAGRRVMVVEDEALVALDLEMTLEDAGAVVVGPFLALPEAMRACAVADVDAAVLDLVLGRDLSHPVAEVLARRGIGTVFHSAHAEARRMPAIYPAARMCPKPCAPATILRAIAEVMPARASLGVRRAEG